MDGVGSSQIAIGGEQEKRGADAAVITKMDIAEAVGFVAESCAATGSACIRRKAESSKRVFISKTP